MSEPLDVIARETMLDNSTGVNWKIKWMKQFCRLIIAGMLCVLMSGCTSLFFYPMKQHVTAPGKFGYDYEDVFLTTEDGLRVHGWWIRSSTPAVGSLFFLHGNAENISTHFRAVLWLVNQGYDAFVLDYRGYGLSEGHPDVPDVFLDIDAGANWLVEKVSKTYPDTGHPIFLYGQSLGASLALKYAALDTRFKLRFNALIAEAPFSRYGSIAKHVASRHWLTWSAQYPALWLMNDEHDPIDAVENIDSVPLMIIHSPDDTVIPQRFGKAVFEKANEPKYWVEARGPHINAAAYLDTRRAMLEFLERYESSQATE